MKTQIEKIKKAMAEERWYRSVEHFKTEKSYEEHLEDLKKRKRKKSLSYLRGINNIFK